MKQRRLNKNLGGDTHVRDHADNIFQSQNHETYGMQVGEILFPEPEPLFRQNMVTVKLSRGGVLSSVAYPGAFIDPVTSSLHGTYEGPIPGQMVTVGFENGNSSTPMVVNRYPYQGLGNTLTESQYINPLTLNGFDSTDVIIGHFSGSFLSFNTGILSGELPGSVTLGAATDLNLSANTNINLSSLLETNIDALTDFNVSSNTNILLESIITAEMTSAITTLTGSTHVALNGNTNFAIKYTEMKTAFDLLKTQINNNLTLIQTAISGLGGVYTPVPTTADMSSSQNTKVLM
jgi:hypothetical protein